MNITDTKDVLYSLGSSGNITIQFTDRASLRRWQTSFNSIRRREEDKIMKAWEVEAEKGLTKAPLVLPWEKVRTWTTGNGLTLKVGVPTPEDLGIITGEDHE